MLRGQKVQSWVDADSPDTQPGASVWAVDSDSADADASSSSEGGDPQQERPSAQAPTSQWAAFHARQRGNTQTFAASQPTQTLLIMRLALGPIVTLFDSMLEQASLRWEMREHAAAMSSGNPLRTRLSESWVGDEASKFLEEVTGLLMSQHELWHTLFPRRHRTNHHAALAFAMLSRSAAGVEHNLVVPHRGFPFRLFSLRRAPPEDVARIAAEIEATPACMMDPFTSDFVRHFAGALAGAEALNTLTSVALVSRLDTARLECRHASLRRVVRKRNQSWTAKVAQLSGDALLLRQRIMEARQAAPSPKTRAKISKVRRGGGAQRAFMSRFLCGKSLAGDRRKREFKLGNEAFRKLSQEERMEMEDEGSKGTRAFRAGGRAFDRRSAKPRVRHRTGPSVPGRSTSVLALASQAGELALAIAELTQGRTAKRTLAAEEDRQRAEAIAKWSDAAAVRTDREILGRFEALAPETGARQLPTGSACEYPGSDTGGGGHRAHSPHKHFDHPILRIWRPLICSALSDVGPWALTSGCGFWSRQARPSFEPAQIRN